MRLNFRTVLLGISFALCAVCSAATLRAETLDSAVTALVSRGSYSGAPASDGNSIHPRVSRNGRFIVFESVSSTLVSSPTVTAGRRHIYLLDRQAGTVELVSVRRTGLEAPADSSTPSVSADGRYVVFASTAAVNTMVSVCNDSCNVEIAHPGTHVYLRDRLANKTSLVSQVTLPIREAAFDETGSVRNQLTEDDPLNAGKKRPVMKVVNRRVAAFSQDGSTAAISANPVISADGQYVAYDTTSDTVAGVSSISNQVKYRDLAAPADYDDTTGLLVNPDLQLEPTAGWLDLNDVRDVFIRDGENFENIFVDLGCKFHFPQGCAIGGTLDSVKPGISDDGSVVSFETATPFLSLDFNSAIDIFSIKLNKITGEIAELNRVSNTTSRILAPNGPSTSTSVSGDGRFIAFQSTATNLVLGDTNGVSDVFVYDSKFFKMVRCVTAGGAQANAAVSGPSLSGNGKFLTMESAATNWGATGGSSNIYLGTLTRNTIGALASCTVELASVGSGTGGNNSSSFSGVGIVPRIVGSVLSSAPAVVYQSVATNLASSADSNGVSDIFQAPFCSDADLASDTDGDGTSACFDQCPNDPTRVEDADSDGDGTPNCADNCPADASKIVPGLCGCGVADTDTDSDGTPDCLDGCPADINKIAPGVCGCGFSDADSNGNGIADCKETVSPTPSPGATPTPSTVRGFVPAAPTVTRQASSAYLVDMSGSGATFGVSKYIVQLFLVSSSGVKYVKQQIATTDTTTLSIAKKGQYKVRYALRATGGQVSKPSPFSGVFTVQRARVRLRSR